MLITTKSHIENNIKSVIITIIIIIIIILKIHYNMHVYRMKFMKDLENR